MSDATARPAPDAPEQEDSGGLGIRNALGTIATTIVTVMAVGVILAVAGSVLGFYRADTVLSGSMRPGYPEGSVVIATRQDSNMLAVGQVIIFTAPAPYGEVVTHRVQTVTRDEKSGRPLITTKGDNNPTADPWKAIVVPVDEVWVVKGRIPLLGWVANWAVRWWPLLVGFVVALPMAAFASNRIRETWGADPDPVDPETDSAADALRADPVNAAEVNADPVNADPVEAAAVNADSADPVPQAVPRSVLSRSLTLLWLLPIAGVMGGAYLIAASGRGDAVTDSARKYAAEQPMNVNDSASGRGGLAAVPTASPAKSTAPPATSAQPRNPAPAPTSSVASGKEILAPGVVRLELKGGAVGGVTIVANAKQEVSQRTVDVVNASTTTIQAIAVSATAQNPTDRRLSVKVCAVEWLNIRGQAACPGASYRVTSMSKVPTSSTLAPQQPLKPDQTLHLLLELRAAYGTAVPGLPQADVTLRLDGGRSR